MWITKKGDVKVIQGRDNELGYVGGGGWRKF